MKRILVIASHPDDEVLGCGGAIKKFVKAKKDVFILILGEGLTSRQPSRKLVNKSALQKLHQTSAKVAKYLGAHFCGVKDLPDNRFDQVALLDIIKIIEEVIKDVRPDTVFVQHGGDLNIDHVQTFRAVLTATRPMEGSCVRALHAYEVNSSTEWAFGQFSPSFKPNYFIDISESLTHKVQAMKLYDGEVRKFPHPRSEQAIIAQSQKWGSVCGYKAAEAFQTIFSMEDFK